MLIASLDVESLGGTIKKGFRGWKPFPTLNYQHRITTLRSLSIGGKNVRI